MYTNFESEVESEVCSGIQERIRSDMYSTIADMR